ncbi:MAG: FHA domain-containing protein [Deltaproteobacteria bacterium]|nr:FHA domain-containing protein [Deltaproteobacteria bacterium]
MRPAVDLKSLKSFACPSCGGEKLLPTKEKIIICQGCLMGYRVKGDVPDFRIDQAISFKKKISKMAQGLNVLLTVLSSTSKGQTRSLRLGHCVVVGRNRVSDFDGDRTVVMKPSEFSFSNLNSENIGLIEQYLSRKNKETGKKQAVSRQNGHVLGDYTRDPDLLIEDPSVSRSHAVLFQDETGLALLDLVSKNGSYVNGKEVEFTKLKHNDVVNVGQVSVKVSFL